MPDLEFMYGAVILGGATFVLLISLVLHLAFKVELILTGLVAGALGLAAFGVYASASYLSADVHSTTPRLVPTRVIGETSAIAYVGLFLLIPVGLYVVFWLLGARKGAKAREKAAFWIFLLGGIVALIGAVVGHIEWEA